MPQQGEPTVALWIRNQSHAQGREVKIYLPEDSHVADIAEKAAGLFRFNGATRSHVDLYVSKADGNQLPMMMPISELEKGQVSVIGVNPENDESAEDALWGRSKSWTGAAQTKRQDTATPTLFRKSDTSYGYDFEAADDDAASVAGRSTASSVKSGGEERARRRRERTAQFADQIEADDGDFHAGASWTASDLLDAGDAGEGGLPKRVRTRTWHAADEKDGGLQNPFDGMPKRAVTCELIGADEDEPEGSTRGAEPGRPEAGKRSRSAGRSNPAKPSSARNSRVTFYEPFAKQGTSATAVADPGTATGAYTPDLHSRIVKAMEQDIFAGTNDVFANKDAPWNKGQDAVPRRPAPAPLIGKSSPAVYVDRIPPDTSDAMIRTAIDSHLEPAGVKKVVSLEVIRNQKTRHCHAFAFLTQLPKDLFSTSVPTQLLLVPPEGSTGSQEYIRIQSSDKARSVPSESTPRSTLHIRMYARRQGWAALIAKMEWAGLLAILEMMEPGITNNITIIADDRSKKNLQVHKSICLAAFFVECKSVSHAQLFRSKMNDRRTTNINGLIFLLQCDYTLTDKKLHDTCKKKDSILNLYANAANVAQEFARMGGPLLWPKNSEQFFEFHNDKVKVCEWSDEDDDVGEWRPPTASRRDAPPPAAAPAATPAAADAAFPPGQGLAKGGSGAGASAGAGGSGAPSDAMVRQLQQQWNSDAANMAAHAAMQAKVQQAAALGVLPGMPGIPAQGMQQQSQMQIGNMGTITQAQLQQLQQQQMLGNQLKALSAGLGIGVPMPGLPTMDSSSLGMLPIFASSDPNAAAAQQPQIAPDQQQPLFFAAQQNNGNAHNPNATR
eukprot:Rhum_TRINITY_DN14709_c3_g1::Rhum_TRINITY_DN14709_c3_g1_i1::g.110731::m.110731